MMRYYEKTVFFSLDVWVNKSLNIQGIKVFFDDYEKAAPDGTVGSLGSLLLCPRDYGALLPVAGLQIREFYR